VRPGPAAGVTETALGAHVVGLGGEGQSEDEGHCHPSGTNHSPPLTGHLTFLFATLPCVLRLFSLLILPLAVAWSSGAAAPSPVPHPFPAPPVRAHAAVVMDAATGKVLMAVNPHLHLAIASTTKVMTAVLALEHGKLSDRIKVPASAFNYEWDATVMGLKAGETVTLRDLLYGLLLPSGADAANTIAIHYAGSESRWVKWMNQKAASLGMHDTHYLTAHGLDTPGQYSSADDLALLGRYAAAIPQLVAITDTPSYTWNGHVLQNLNHVIRWYPGADGLKPGYTDAAGICQLLDVHREGKHLIAAILNTPDAVIDARDVLNYGVGDFTWIQTALAGDSPTLQISGTDARGPFIYFPASGHYLRPPFLAVYQSDGSVPSLGFPRTEPARQNGVLTQYFQNGALAVIHGAITRLPLGLSAVTVPTPTTTPPEGTATPPRGTIHARGNARNTTVTAAFRHYAASHPRLGAPVGSPITFGPDPVQVYRYGALVYDPTTRTVWLLPLGDHVLASEHVLPKGSGNAYPPNFAPQKLLKQIGWLSG